MIKLIVILIFINIFANEANGQESYCLSIFSKNGEKYLPLDNTDQFILCKEHEKRTCCKRNHSESIAKLFSALITKSSLSNKCSMFYQKLICSFCDAEVGVGNKIQYKSPVICQSYCNMWYNACFNDYFDNIQNSYFRNNEDISFIRLNIIPCTDSSVICSSLRSITDNPQEFCSLNGFAIYSDNNLHFNEYNHNCFNGISASSILKPGIKVTNRYKKTIYKSRNKIHETLFSLLKSYINKFYRQLSIPLPAIIFITIIILWSVNRLISILMQ